MSLRINDDEHDASEGWGLHPMVDPRRLALSLSWEGLDAEAPQQVTGADHVDDRVHGADLVEAHPLNRHPMHPGLGLGQGPEGGDGGVLHGLGQGRVEDHPPNLRPVPAGVMVVAMPVIVPMIVVMAVIVPVFMVALIGLGHRRGAVVVKDHIKMKPGDHPAAHPGEPQREAAEPEVHHHAVKLGRESLGVAAGVKKRRAEHVSGETCPCVEPGERHGSRLMRVA